MHFLILISGKCNFSNYKFTYQLIYKYLGKEKRTVVEKNGKLVTI